MVRVRNFPTGIDHVHAMIEFVADSRGVVEALDHFFQFLLYGLVLDLQPRKPLDQIDARAGCV